MNRAFLLVLLFGALLGLLAQEAAFAAGPGVVGKERRGHAGRLYGEDARRTAGAGAETLHRPYA
jgi:hypothetical protein